MVGVVRLGGEDFPVLIANTWLGEAVASVLLANVLPAEAVVGAFVQPEGVHVLEAEQPHPEVRRDDVVMARGVQANGAVAMTLHRESLNEVIPIQLDILAHAYDDVDDYCSRIVTSTGVERGSKRSLLLKSVKLNGMEADVISLLLVLNWNTAFPFKSRGTIPCIESFASHSTMFWSAADPDPAQWIISSVPTFLVLTLILKPFPC